MSRSITKAIDARRESAKVAGTLRVPLLWAHRRRICATTFLTSYGMAYVGVQRGCGTRSVPATIRRGVTLIELLIVILIMLMITAITIPVIAPAMKGRDVREAARMIDVFINGARTRAQSTGHNYGIIIERMPGLPNGSVTLSYCEQPDAYTGDYASTVSFPGMPAGSSGSTILLLGNGGFGQWMVGPPTPTTAAVNPATYVFPKGDTGWIAGPAPTGTGWLTNIAPGDVMVVNNTSFRIWAGEPFIDIDQNGVWSNPITVFSPDTPIGVVEPFLDVDGNGTWTPPNYPNMPLPYVFNPNLPYVDPRSGYFVQPNAAAGSPFPLITWGTQCATITYAPFDPVSAATTIGTAYVATAKAQSMGLPMPPNVFASSSVLSPPTGSNFKFSFLRRPVKTSGPSIQLPDGAAIDLGANYFFSTQPPPNIVPIPGSGIEVLVSSANAYGWWSTFRPNPALDPTIPGSLASLPTTNPSYQPPDPTSIMITFQPSGTVDKVYSWSEANNTNSAMTAVNWSDWQGRIPAGPIYLLIGRQELINGDPTTVPLMAELSAQSPQPPMPIFYNVQDPKALWVAINPQTGAVATAENVGYNPFLSMNPTGSAGSTNTVQNMGIYWAATVYSARRLARAMLDMGGR